MNPIVKCEMLERRWRRARIESTIRQIAIAELRSCLQLECVPLLYRLAHTIILQNKLCARAERTVLFTLNLLIY